MPERSLQILFFIMKTSVHIIIPNKRVAHSHSSPSNAGWSTHREEKLQKQTCIHAFLDHTSLSVWASTFIPPSFLHSLSSNEALILMRPHFLKCYKDVVDLQEKQLNDTFNSKQLTCQESEVAEFPLRPAL